MSITRHHAEWLSLVETSGPFFSLPVLMRAFPQGLEAHEPALFADVRLAWEEWDEACHNARPDIAIHHAWLDFVLHRVLDWPQNQLQRGAQISAGIETRLESGETLRADAVLANADGTPRVLLNFYAPDQNLQKPLRGALWHASPHTRMAELLRATDVPLGLCTNGDEWTLVWAPRGETSGFTTWKGELWLEERLTFRAFRAVLGAMRLFGVPDEQTTEALLRESANDQQEVTDRLGAQVRRAVETLVSAFDSADEESGGALLQNVTSREVYEAALTIMMRLVFLFCAEERHLLLSGENPIYDDNYAVSKLRAELREAADYVSEETIARRRDAWCRLLATFRAIHGGVAHDLLPIPAYGGTLFDPDRFPFLEGRAHGTNWRDETATNARAMPIDNRVVLHLLEALQVLEVPVAGGGREARILSFRALDIEQIGHVYEGLLDHTARRAETTYLALSGSSKLEPEISLEEMETRATDRAKFIKFLAAETGRSPATLTRLLDSPTSEITAQRMGALRRACADEDVLNRVLDFANLLRNDSFERPVIIRRGRLFVTQSGDRRASGTHYTSRALTEPLVRRTLEPLLYRGFADGIEASPQTLRSPREILALKICDPACGSASILVQSCRYLAEKLVEAWEIAERDGLSNAETPSPALPLREGKGDERILSGASINIEYSNDAAPQTPLVPQSREKGLGEKGFATLPYAEAAHGLAGEEALPDDLEERLIVAKRLIADRCLYGVDRDPLAVEMAKLSLWLITMQRGKPFTFIDHAIRCGDSLLGVDAAQLRNWSLERRDSPLFRVPLQSGVERAIALRREINEMPDNSIEDIYDKTRRLQQADAATERAKLAGDIIVASAFAEKKAKRAEWLKFRNVRFVALQNAETEAELRAEIKPVLPPFPTFHWPLEFPEVFYRDDENPVGTQLAASADSNAHTTDAASCVPTATVENSNTSSTRTDATRPSQNGFDAIIGNPPFAGGQRITGDVGVPYREYLISSLARGVKGSADLVAYFYLRAFDLLRDDGCFGLIATNTIAQGDTREVGLDQLCARGATIYAANPSQPWPGEANLEVAIVHIRKGAWSNARSLSDAPVAGITPYLAAPGTVGGNPRKLVANEGKSFQGSIVLGMGFVLEPHQAQALIEKDARNAQVLFPYLNGEDLNSRVDQSPSRWVIHFDERTEEEARSYPDVWKIAE